MEQNDANRANFIELGEHIKRLGQRAGANPTPEIVEDLEDNYERLLQLRVMRNNDLELDLVEARAALRWRDQVGVAVVGIAVLQAGAGVEVLFPGLWLGLGRLGVILWTRYPGVAVSVGVMASGWPRVGGCLMASVGVAHLGGIL